MAKAFLSNHSAVRVRRAEREWIRTFYRDVLGCEITREIADKDDIRLGDDFHTAFLCDAGDGREVDKGDSYAAEDALSDQDFLKAVFLELKTGKRRSDAAEDRSPALRARISRPRARS